MIVNHKCPFVVELREPNNPLKPVRADLAHDVVVDGLDARGNVMIRDPVHGTRYEMSRVDFDGNWNGHVMYRR